MKKRGSRGPVPSAELLAKMHEAGYYLVKEIAHDLKIKLTTLYTWADPENPKLQAMAGKPPTKKVGSNLWILKAAVEAKQAIPAEMGVG
jgi:hypothetical protein